MDSDETLMITQRRIHICEREDLDVNSGHDSPDSLILRGMLLYGNDDTSMLNVSILK